MITKGELRRLRLEFPEGIPPYLLCRGHSAASLRAIMQMRRDAPEPAPQFMIAPEDYDEAVFRAASYFTVSIGRNPVTRRVLTVLAFPTARETAEAYGPTALVYAVTPTDRSTLLVRQRWDYYTKIWESTHHG